jgi:hypothetical protein
LLQAFLGVNNLHWTSLQHHGNCSITNLYSDNCNITNLYSDNCNITNLYSDNFNITNLYSDNFYITNLYSDNCYITNLYSDNCNITNLYSDNCNITNLYSANTLFRIISIPTTFGLFLVLTSEQIDRRLPVFMLLLWQRQHIIVVDAVDYK